MQTELLTLDKLHLLDSDLVAAFDEQVALAVMDCMARSTLEADRCVTIELRICPVEDDPEDVIIDWDVALRTPAQKRTKKQKRGVIRARRSRLGQLQFDF